MKRKREDDDEDEESGGEEGDEEDEGVDDNRDDADEDSDEKELAELNGGKKMEFRKSADRRHEPKRAKFFRFSKKKSDQMKKKSK